MTQEGFINILVAEDNDVSRELMAGILRAQGYRVFGAIDGESAIKVVEDRDIDLALVDINMSPKGGFEFVKFLVVKGIDTPVVIVTGDDSTNILVDASSLGVVTVLQKPVDPDKLLQVVNRILKRRGFNTNPLAIERHDARDAKLSPEDLMKKAISLADKNARSKHGGPFGAVVADADGKILGEGVDSVAARLDPTAYAEVMAIRAAVTKLGKADLSACALYCSSEPTTIGQALIIDVGIPKVYYALSNEEGRIARGGANVKPKYAQLSHDQALAVFQNWQAREQN